MKKRSFFYSLAVLSFIISIALVPAASQAAVIFQDGFESGNITSGGWSSSGVLSMTTSAYNGSYAVNIDDTGSLQKIVSTAGYTGITLAYARYTDRYDYGEELTVQWSTNGSNWNTIETYNSGWALNQVQLPAGAEGQSTLYIRFISDASGWYERFRLDDVSISGTLAGGGSNDAPEFIQSTITAADGNVNSAYSGSIAGFATDPNAGDILTYTKTEGPAWLSVGANGTLYGTPTSDDAGLNGFTVKVTDNGGLSDTAILVVNVTGGAGPTCLPEVEDFTEAGPFGVDTDTLGSYGSTVKVWIPENLPTGCKVPIIHLANGTGASCSNYSAILNHYASHGFIAACYEDTDTGQGTQAIDAINIVIAEYPNMVDTIYGFTGHSQGGGGAIMGVYRAEQEWGTARTYTGFAIEPANGFGDSPYNWEDYYEQIYSPIAMFNGSRDMLVSASWVRDGYDALPNNLEKAWYEAVGAGHMTPIPQSYASEMGLAWFRWQLLGDSDACEYFKNMPDDSRDWDFQETDNLSPCN